MRNRKELVLLREGECLRCGMCCMLGPLVDTPAFKNASKSKKLEKFISENNVSDVYCKHYDTENKLCMIFNELKRPEVCINHPGSPNSIIPGCGYKFRFKKVSKSELKRLEESNNAKIFRRNKI